MDKHCLGQIDKRHCHHCSQECHQTGLCALLVASKWLLAQPHIPGTN